MVCPLCWQYLSYLMICLESCCTCFRSPWLHSMFQVICRTVYIPRVRRCWDPGIWGPESLFILSQRSPVRSNGRECSSRTWDKPSISIWAHWLWWELWEVSGSRPMISHVSLFFHVQGCTCRGHGEFKDGSQILVCLKNYLGNFTKIWRFCPEKFWCKTVLAIWIVILEQVVCGAHFEKYHSRYNRRVNYLDMCLDSCFYYLLALWLQANWYWVVYIISAMRAQAQQKAFHV